MKMNTNKQTYEKKARRGKKNTEQNFKFFEQDKKCTIAEQSNRALNFPQQIWLYLRAQAHITHMHMGSVASKLRSACDLNIISSR